MGSINNSVSLLNESCECLVGWERTWIGRIPFARAVEVLRCLLTGFVKAVLSVVAHKAGRIPL